MNLWNDRVIRSSMMNHFHVNIYEHLDLKSLQKLLPSECGILIADARVYIFHFHKGFILSFIF